MRLDAEMKSYNIGAFVGPNSVTNSWKPFVKYFQPLFLIFLNSVLSFKFVSEGLFTFLVHMQLQGAQDMLNVPILIHVQSNQERKVNYCILILKYISAGNIYIIRDIYLKYASNANEF